MTILTIDPASVGEARRAATARTVRRWREAGIALLGFTLGFLAACALISRFIL